MKTKQSLKSQNVSNCHRQGCKTQTSTVSETKSDQDSANSKYVVKDDKRKRKDGPGGD